MSVKSVKRPATLRKLLSAAGTVLTVGAFDPPDAYAGDAFGGFAGGFVGGFVGGMLRGMGPPRYHRNSGGAPSYHTHSSHNSGAAAVEPPSSAEASRALASLAPPTTGEQQAILKSVRPGQSLGAVGASDDLEQIGKDDAEASRDYTGKIDDLIKRIQRAQNAQHSTKEGDVTEHGILEALDSSIREANLTKFETFLGENWSPERLRVMILERVGNEIGGLFEGTNRGAVTMNDLDMMIAKSARSVYARLFETSELLAANRSSTLFVQRLYQTHGDLVNGEVRESTEQLLADASASGLASLEPFLRRDPNAFALRYRAQRVIYDCLSDNVEAITSSESGMATSAEISQRVLDVTQQQCAKWVSTQLIGGDNKVKPQDPMPLRVIWTAEGPKDDPSMYGRSTDQL